MAEARESALACIRRSLDIARASSLPERASESSDDLHVVQRRRRAGAMNINRRFLAV